ncbi:MAG TPA: hypothetical protein VJS92_07150 [Candidatus Polarisedimenticolaceae bacterium]|nr:hypothetical protein [Candidatus Polarisedimenticolaceae bacterium]
MSILSSPRSSIRAAMLALLGTLVIAQAQAFRAPVGEPLQSLQTQVLAPAGFVATVVPVELSEVLDQVPAETLSAVSAFEAEAGPHWRFYVDRRSGGMALVEGAGLDWKGQLDDLEAASRSFVQRYPGLFGVPESQLVLDARGSVNLGPRRQYWSVVFKQVVDGVPVEGARVVFRVSNGRLVQFGVDRTVPLGTSLKSAAGLLSPSQARDALGSYLGSFRQTDRIVEDGTLVWIPRGVDESGAYKGPIGAGWKPEIVYRFTFVREGSPSTWQGLVDAKTGEVLRFVDATDYASLVKASVYTLTNCADPLNCVPGTASETGVTLPAASLNFAGGTCSGDACYTNSAGAFDYPAGAVSASTALDGQHFRLIDNCGALAASAVAPGNIDLGTSTSNPPLNTNTDCASATRESPPNSGPVFGGSGDTHSARNTFYHLNIINQKGRVYLPDNEWLKGIDGSAGSAILNVNLPPACNAFWQGTTGSLNFTKQTPGLGCNNTGEIPDVFLHEWGHGLDQNDGTGTAPESGTGEAMGDTFALLQGQHSCIGPGFLLDVSGAWGNQAGYGTGSALCTGVRDIDYTRFCYHGTAASCSPSPDPGDAPNGSRSGFSPPASTPDSGTPARWNTMITGASNATNGQSNFYNCGGPELDGCAGALDHGCHCESTIGSQANWDLAKKLIAFEFGGDVYRVPQGPTEVSGWQYMDRLWYLTRDLAVSSYSATGPAPTGTTNGCGINNWFSTYRFIDDDNGDLSDGTPHAGILFQAFDLHAIACGSANDPQNQPTGCPAPAAAPTLSACDNKSPVQLDWTASASATEYRILRNTLGCGFGFTPVATVGGGRLYYEDAEVAPGVAYYYSVQPVGGNESCYGEASNCVAVTPSSCAATSVTPPTGLALTKPANNQVNVAWNAVAGAGSYKVYRKPGSCDSASPFAAIGVVTAPTHAFLDTDGLLGQQTYAYQVSASDTSCASCTSAPSACQSVVVDGACVTAPDFGGLATISAPAQNDCRLDLSWSAATAHCSGALTYSVYRSTSSTFVPGPATLVASGLTAASYSDFAVVGGTRYYYIVRALDGSGNNDGNLVRLSEIPVGTLTPGTFTDNAGDTGTAKFGPGTIALYSNTWSIRPNDNPDDATKVYASTSTGNYVDSSCMGLESQTIFLGANPTLSFRSRYDMEQGWDGGYVDVATEAGGFNDWTKLTTINYPGIMSGPIGDPACGTPGFANGQQVFTGTSAAGYQTFSGSLSAYANQRVRVRFLFSSDDSTNQTGWFIDDVSITGAMLPGPCTTDLCAQVSCDDSDACTTDACDPADGQCSFTPLPPPAEVGSSLVLNKSGGTALLSWSDGGNPGTFGPYRGTRDVPWSYNQQCLGGLVSGTSTSDGSTPAVGSTFFYFVSRKTSCGESVLGRDSGGQPIPNSSPCP